MDNLNLLLEDLRAQYEQYPYETDFIVHEHYATHHHFDLRIRRGDVAPSWALPKARFPFETNERMLAVRTPDHPISWMTFKGTIPHGQYGAGKVFIYDKGKCIVHKWGEVIVVELKGNHITGFFLLIHTKGDNWLIIRPDQEKTKIKYTNKMSEAMFAAYEYCPVAVIGAVIHNPESKFSYLLEAHVKSGLWTIPSGKVDMGEDPADCMVREIKEEVGIDVISFELIKNEHIEYPLKDGSIVKTDGYLFDVLKYNGEPTNVEPEKHSALKWVPLHELRNMKDITEITKWFLSYMDNER